MPIINIDVPLQPKQQELWDLVDGSPHTWIGFGGAKGGGKSDGARKVLLRRRAKYPMTNGTIFRRTYRELYGNHIEPLFRQYPFMRAWYRDKDKELTLPNGSKIFFRYAEHKCDIYGATQGIESADVLFDEATLFEEDEIEEMCANVRWTQGGNIVPKRILTMNPGGIGHEFIKRIFIERSYRNNENPDRYAFIQAYGWDNVEWSRSSLEQQGLSDRDYYGWTDQERFAHFTSHSDYGIELNALSEKRRKALLFGDWYSFAGQYFSNFVRGERAIRASDCARLLRDKFWWPRWASHDWGYAHHSSMHWHATGELTPAEALEYLGKTWETNRTIFLTYRELIVNQTGEREMAEKFAQRCDDLDRRTLKRYFLSPDAFAKKGSAHTVADQLASVFRENSLPGPELADNDRIGGWRLMHEIIQSDQWFFSEACPEALNAIPALMHDEDNLEDVLKTDKMSDDIADELRYGMKSYLRPRSVPREVQLMEVLQAAPNHTARHMADLKFQVDWAKKHGAIKRPARWR